MTAPDRRRKLIEQMTAASQDLGTYDLVVPAPDRHPAVRDVRLSDEEAKWIEPAAEALAAAANSTAFSRYLRDTPDRIAERNTWRAKARAAVEAARPHLEAPLRAEIVRWNQIAAKHASQWTEAAAEAKRLRAELDEVRHQLRQANRVLRAYDAALADERNRAGNGPTIAADAPDGSAGTSGHPQPLTEPQSVPLSQANCAHCGRLVVYNLAAGIVRHVGETDQANCPTPWPASPISDEDFAGYLRARAAHPATDGDQMTNDQGVEMTNRPNLVPIYDAVDRAMRDELAKWTQPVAEELRLALSRAVVGTLRDASMLNYDRPWELDDRLADVLTDAGEVPPTRHASPRCGCGINDAGQRFVDPICRD